MYQAVRRYVRRPAAAGAAGAAGVRRCRRSQHAGVAGADGTACSRAYSNSLFPSSLAELVGTTHSRVVQRGELRLA